MCFLGQSDCTKSLERCMVWVLLYRLSINSTGFDEDKGRMLCHFTIAYSSTIQMVVIVMRSSSLLLCNNS